MKYALKEWSSSIETLNRGILIALWRRGGIEDLSFISPEIGFPVDQKQFVFFPTFTHQDLNKVKKDFWNLFDPNNKPNKDNQIKIKCWAEVEEEINIETKEQLLSISSELIYSQEYLETSWNLYPKNKGTILLLRVYSLCDPILVTNSPEYSGCKSWVELKIDIPKAGSTPVLQFKDFNRKARLIKNILLDSLEKQKVLA